MAIDSVEVLSCTTCMSWKKILTLMTRPATCFPQTVRLYGKLSVFCPQINSGEIWSTRTDR